MMAATLLIGCTSCEAKNYLAAGDSDTPTPQFLGAMSPQQALAYMKTTENLIIVDVASRIVPGAYRSLKELRSDIPAISYIDGAPLFDEYNSWKNEQEHKNENDITGSERYLGGLTPSDALEYMKSTPNLYIIDVREDDWYEGYTQFVGNIHIPRTQLPERYTEIPSDRPVILNCGAGVQAPRAYDFLREKRADIKQLSYIAGTPLFAAYNNWLKELKK